MFDDIIEEFRSHRQLAMDGVTGVHDEIRLDLRESIVQLLESISILITVLVVPDVDV
jgi:hypothetical protein